MNWRHGRLVRLGLVGAGAVSKGGDEVNLVSDLGLDIVREPVAVVTRESLAARHGGGSRLGPHLLDVVLVVGIHDGRDIEISLAVPAAEGDLTKHTGLISLALLDSVEVANVFVREVDSNLLGRADSNRFGALITRVRGEDDGALLVVKSDKCDRGSGGIGSRGDEADESSSELHVGGVILGIVMGMCLYGEFSIVVKTRVLILCSV